MFSISSVTRSVTINTASVGAGLAATYMLTKLAEKVNPKMFESKGFFNDLFNEEKLETSAIAKAALITLAITAGTTIASQIVHEVLESTWTIE